MAAMATEEQPNAERISGPLGKLEAEAIAAEIRTIHPQADALVLYAFGRGGYGVVARSPLPGQDDVLLLSRVAYRTFQVLRADAWRRQWNGRAAQETMAERVEEAAMSALRLRDEREGR